MRRSASRPRGRAGSSRIPTSCGRVSRPPRQRRSPTRASARASSTRSGSQTSVRRRSSGTDAPASRSTGDRVAGPAHRRALPRAARRRDPRAHRAHTRPVLLGDEARVDPARARLRRDGARVRHRRLWLLWQLTAARVHATDMSNASRTMLLDLDDARLERRAARALRRAAASCCRDVLPSARPFGDGRCSARRLPVAALAGDQQASLYGQACVRRRPFGTGCVRARRTRARITRCRLDGLVRTAACRCRPRRTRSRASIFVAGAAVQWLRDGLGCSRTPPRAKRSRGRSTRPTASTSCRRSPGSAHRIGRRTRADRSAGSHAARGASTRSRRARGDGVPGARRRRRDDANVRRCSASTAARRRTAFSCSSSPTCSTFRSRSQASARRPRSARRRWQESQSGAGPTTMSRASGARRCAASRRPTGRRPSQAGATRCGER